MQGSLPIPYFGQVPAGAGSGGSSLAPGAWSSVTLTNGDGTAITLGQLCYLSANDTARKGQADGTEDEATIVCVCVATSISAGASGLFVFGGIVTGLSGGVAGDPAYLSATAGAISATPVLTAGQYNVLIGIWQSTTKLQFNPQLPILN